MKKWKLVLIIIGSIIVVGLTVTGILFSIMYRTSMGEIFITTGLTTVAVVISFIITDFSSSRSHKSERDEIDRYYKDIKENLKESLGKKANILELMLANMKEIKEYYVLSKSQAKKAFTVAILMGIFGFILIGVSIILSIIYKENLAATLIPAIGAVVVDLLSATFLFVYKKSLEQLNHYYSELHDNEEFLSAVNLVDSISAEEKDKVLIEIIKSRIDK